MEIACFYEQADVVPHVKMIADPAADADPVDRRVPAPAAADDDAVACAGTFDGGSG
jgi:hypothetical protein